MCDKGTQQIAQVLHEPFRLIGSELSGYYGGIMDHLWIDFELIRKLLKPRDPYPFRFQKRVSGKSRLTGIDQPDKYNVGHYSVRPDFDYLLEITIEQSVLYALSLIYNSLSVLDKNAKRLGGFDANLFRSRFLSVCRANGYKIEKT